MTVCHQCEYGRTSIECVTRSGGVSAECLASPLAQDEKRGGASARNLVLSDRRESHAKRAVGAVAVAIAITGIKEASVRTIVIVAAPVEPRRG